MKIKDIDLSEMPAEWLEAFNLVSARGEDLNFIRGLEAGLNVYKATMHAIEDAVSEFCSKESK